MYYVLDINAVNENFIFFVKKKKNIGNMKQSMSKKKLFKSHLITNVTASLF